MIYCYSFRFSAYKLYGQLFAAESDVGVHINQTHNYALIMPAPQKDGHKALKTD